MYTSYTWNFCLSYWTRKSLKMNHLPVYQPVLSQSINATTMMCPTGAYIDDFLYGKLFIGPWMPDPWQHNEPLQGKAQRTDGCFLSRMSMNTILPCLVRVRRQWMWPRHLDMAILMEFYQHRRRETLRACHECSEAWVSDGFGSTGAPPGMWIVQVLCASHLWLGEVLLIVDSSGFSSTAMSWWRASWIHKSPRDMYLRTAATCMVLVSCPSYFSTTFV